MNYQIILKQTQTTKHSDGYQALVFETKSGKKKPVQIVYNLQCRVLVTQTHFKFVSF